MGIGTSNSIFSSEFFGEGGGHNNPLLFLRGIQEPLPDLPGHTGLAFVEVHFPTKQIQCKYKKLHTSIPMIA